MVIDTDLGVDDAAALWWAVTDPRLDVVAVTVVWGNVDLDVAGQAVLHVLEASGRDDIPVALGESGPIGPAPDLRPATFIHGDDGLGNTVTRPPRGKAVDEPAGELLRRVAPDPSRRARRRTARGSRRRSRPRPVRPCSRLRAAEGAHPR